MKNEYELSYIIRSLKVGIHEFEENLESPFFKQFENEGLKDASFVLNLTLDKRSDMVVVDINFHGSVKENCDSCTANIDLPIEGEDQLFIKYGDTSHSTDTVIYLKDENHVLDLTNIVYELIHLSIPIKKVYDCSEDEKPPCDFNVLKNIEEYNSFEEEEAPVKKGVWDTLKDFNN